MDPSPDAQPTLYDDPVIYDILHAPGTAEEVTCLERIEQRFVPSRARSVWLEPACGTARHLRLAAKRRRDRRVFGFDRSETMITDARARADRAGLNDRCTLSIDELKRFTPPARTKVSLAFTLINTFRHLPDDRAARAHMKRIAECLHPKGLYAVGLSTTGYGYEPPTEDVWTSARGACKVTQVVQYEPPQSEAAPRLERVTSHLTIETPSGARHADSSYTLRTYSLDQWLELISSTALALEATVDELARDADPAPCGYRVYLLRPR